MTLIDGGVIDILMFEMYINDFFDSTAQYCTRCFDGISTCSALKMTPARPHPRALDVGEGGVACGGGSGVLLLLVLVIVIVIVIVIAIVMPPGNRKFICWI